MHSSKMRTTRLLTVSQHALARGCVYPSTHWAVGVSHQGRGVSAQGVWQTPPWDQRQTPPCEQNNRQV